MKKEYEKIAASLAAMTDAQRNSVYNRSSVLIRSIGQPRPSNKELALLKGTTVFDFVPPDTRLTMQKIHRIEISSWSALI